jgi:hypothetical protein
VARFSLFGATGAYKLELAFKALYRALQRSPISLHLRFTGSTARSGTAALTLKVCPQPAKSWDLVSRTRELNLQRAFLRVGARRENIQDQLGAIDRLAGTNYRF